MNRQSRRLASLLLGQLLSACDGAGEGNRPGIPEAEPTADTTAASMDSQASSGEQDHDPDTTGTTSGGNSSSGPGCTPLPWFPDGDRDGFGLDEGVVMTCAPPLDHVANGGDCNDDDAAINISADEVCDQVDNDCDQQVDEPAKTNPSCGGCSLFEAGSTGYAVCPAAASWAEAQASCEASFGGTLVVIDGAAENAAVIALATAKTPSVWIGLSDLRVEGTFLWPDGTSPRYTTWNAGEPNDAGGNEDCTQLDAASGYWNDLDCTVSLPYICENAGLARNASRPR